MDARSLDTTVRMLQAVLDGRSYKALAAECGISPSAVEQRVKALGRDLQVLVGVEGVDEDEVPTVRLMRAHQAGYLEALEHYAPQRRSTNGARAGPLARADLARAVAITQRRSRHPERDVALLLVLFATAAKPLEIARLEVRDYLTEAGAVREESVLPAAAAINGQARPLLFASASLVTALDAYLEQRRRHGQGTTPCSSAYRGLDPESRLFLCATGAPLTIKAVTADGVRQHRCDTILNLYQKIFARAGLKGRSALCARRTVAQRLTEQGCDLDQVRALLGLSDRDSVRRLIDRQEPIARPLKALARDLV